MTDPEKNLPETIEDRPCTKVIVVAPVWLKEALLILLKSAPGIQLVTSVVSVAELLEKPPKADPDLVLIDGKRELEQAFDQVSQVKARWPGAFCIILVDHIRQQGVLKAAGADQILVKGVSPQRLLSAIRQGEAGRTAQSSEGAGNGK
jgi:two-component system, NarL family, invasion response regulator UvrY